MKNGLRVEEWYRQRNVLCRYLYSKMSFASEHNILLLLIALSNIL